MGNMKLPDEIVFTTLEFKAKQLLSQTQANLKK